MTRKPAKKPARKPAAKPARKAVKKAAAKPAKKAAKKAVVKPAAKKTAAKKPVYKLIDPRPFVKENPYTYFVPTPKQLAGVAPGHKVYVTFQAVPPRKKWDSERMWVKVTQTSGGRVHGILDNEPDDIPGLSRGEAVAFNRWHIISLDWADPAIAQRYTDSQREYWERCYVDQAVVDGKLKVEYLYREAPSMAQKDDHYPDSGWRIRGDSRGATADQVEKREAAYIAIGVVLNQDDSWLHLIDEPIGSEFERNYRTRKYERVGKPG